MPDNPIRKPRCDICPHNKHHNEPVPRKVQGAFLRVGSRYCTGGKKIKVFKPRDPKVYVPSWCPRRKTPAELRIYCFKNTNAWFLNHLLNRDGVHPIPSGYDYAVRHESRTEVAAKYFYELLQEKTITEILGVRVRTNEIIEIDDGLKPYYFHVGEYGVEVLSYFNGEAARQNKLEQTDIDLEEGSF